MKLTTINNFILFKFLNDATSKNKLNSVTNWGFEIRDTKREISNAQWGEAYVVGPECAYVKTGDFILIDALKWSTPIFDGEEKLWKTAEDQVLCVSKDRPSIY